MIRGGSAAALLGVAAILACGCSPSGGGGTASSQPAPSGAAPAPASSAASDTAASALPPAPATPSAAPAMAPKPPPTAAELLRDDAGYQARQRKLDALYENAKERDPTGEVERQQSAALARRRACADKACLDAWFARREAALRTYVEN